jgi:decaprenylphospho-beta-D-erythro-pentofuranosid-2-ulose 2-reductase
MTAGMRKNPLFASAESVGRGVYDAIRARKRVAYVPGFWRWISLVVKMLPAPLVKF